MQGYVLAFRPGLRQGTIVAEGGRSFNFVGNSLESDVDGGDIVTFKPRVTRAGQPRYQAIHVRVVEKWSERLKSCQGNLLGELHMTIQSEGALSRSH